MLIEVQHCIDCHLHNWCSRHNEAKYHEFYNKLEAKIKSIDRQAQITKNQLPIHYQEKDANAGGPQAAHRYFDQERNEDVVFPRHGAFEVKVNGVLIFSKLQSNLWPNLQKIAILIARIRGEVDAGRDILKFSLDYRLENNNREDEKFVDTYKRLIKFKINKRPHSSQFNASAYLRKGSLEQTPEAKHGHLKRKNVTSLKKGAFDLHRKSDVTRKPLIRFRNSKVEQNNLYNQFQQPKDNEERTEHSQIGKIVKNQYISPHSKKKIQFKNQVLHPIKAQPFQILPNNNNGSALKLQKKPSRKLIIKANDKKSEHFSQYSSKFGENIEEPIGTSSNVIINQNPAFFTNISTKKSLKSVMSIGDKLQSKDSAKRNQRGFNQIKVEDYFTEKQIVKNKMDTEKQIQKQKQKQKEESQQPLPPLASIEPIHYAQTQQDKFQVRKEHTEKLVSQYDVNQFEDSPQVLQNKSKKAVQKQQIQTKGLSKQEGEEHQEIIECQQQICLQTGKRDTQKSNQKYEQELYDKNEVEQEEEEIRPATSSSRRMLKEQIKREEEILEYQEVVEGNFKKKGNLTAQIFNQQCYDQQEFPAEETEEVPITVNQRQQQVKEEKNIGPSLAEQEVEPVEQLQEVVQNEVQPQLQPQGQEEEVYEIQPIERKQLIYEFDEQEAVETPKNKSQQQVANKKEEAVQSQRQIYQAQLIKNEKQNIQEENITSKQALIASPEIDREQVAAAAEKQVKDQIQVEQPTSTHQQIEQLLNQAQIAKQQPQKQAQSNLQSQVPQPASQHDQQQVKEESKLDQQQPVEPEPVEEYQEQHEQLQKQVPIENEVNKQKSISAPAIPADEEALKQQQMQKQPILQQIQKNPLIKQANQDKPKEIQQEDKPSIQHANNQQPKLDQIKTHHNIQQQHQQQVQSIQQQPQPSSEKQQQQQPQPQQQPQAQPQPFRQQQLQPPTQTIPQQIQSPKQESNVPFEWPVQEPKNLVETLPKELIADIEPLVSQKEQRQQVAKQQEVVDAAPIKRQNNLPSIHCIASVQSARGPESLRSIPNVTQSSIGLTSQIHSELNNVYEQIEARIDARISLDEQQQ